jgi:hypothetical protein
MAFAGAAHDVRWLALDRSVRQRVSQSVRTGRPVSTPDEAPVAVGYCAARLDWLSQRGRLRPFQLAVALVIFGELMVTRTVLILPWIGAALGFAFLRWRTPVLRRRLAAALTVNEEAAAESGLTPTRVHLPGESWLRPGRRRRGLMLFLGTALALVLYVLVAANFLIQTRGH